MNVNDQPFYLYVNSNDRTSGTNTSFDIEFNNFTGLMGRHCRVQLVSAEVALGSIYQVEAGNNTFCFSVDGTSTLSFDITPGTYTVTSLLSLLKSNMETLDALANVYDFAYNQDTNCISITPSYASGTLELRGNLNSDRVNEILGLSSDLVVVANATQYIFPRQVNMFPNYNFYLTCDAIYSRNMGSGTQNFVNALVKMSLAHRFTRSIFHYEDYDTYSMYIRQFPGRMRFCVVNENGNVATIPSNLPTTLTLKIFPMT
jgi:hypothetical protein